MNTTAEEARAAEPERAPSGVACRIFHSPRVSTDWFPATVEEVTLELVQEVHTSGLAGLGPIVVILDSSLAGQLRDLRAAAPHAVFIAADARAEELLAPHRYLSLVGATSAHARTHLLEAACELACARLAVIRGRRRLLRMRRAMSDLNQVGSDLMDERDEQQLLRQIVEVGKRLTMSDGGGLLLAEYDGNSPGRLRVAHADFDTIQKFEPSAQTVPIDDSSIIGHAAAARHPIVIADAYDLGADASFVMDPSFDHQYRYRRRSMLIVPMVDHRAHLVGVLVFINRKSEPGARITSKRAADRYVLPYGARELRLARALAGQAAVSIENTRLYEQIERMLESFVKAAVTAIDQRDPTTAGHSLRVATLSTSLAEAVDRDHRGGSPLAHFSRKQMRELRFAALLHDFGKVAVREELLVKAKKLPRVLWERVNARFDVIHRTLELEACRRSGDESSSEQADAIAELTRMRELVAMANEPSIVDQVPPAQLSEIANHTFRQPDGRVMPYLTAEELHYLQLSRGTLDDVERAEIQSHVEETYQFLVKIPWTDDLRNVANFAYCHHEKLDGSGYPQRLDAAEIPLQARIITIADIFDALTSADRPYKPAVPVGRALEILQREAAAGLLDRQLVDIMVESRSYQRVLQDDWRSL